MKNYHEPPGTFLIGVVILFCGIMAGTQVFAQRELNTSETAIVEEAFNELQEAISDPHMPQAERLRIVERSAKTLKEYGQPYAFPEGDIPLKRMMEYSYKQGRKEFEDANDLKMALSNKLLDRQLKLINTMQIEIAEEQIKIMIPGLPAPYELSKELVSKVFNWNIVEGFNTGTYGDAQSLVRRFKQLAELKMLGKELDNLYGAQQMSANQLSRDYKMVDQIEAQLRKKYELADAGTHVLVGLEGATLPQGKTAGLQKSNSYLLDPNLIGIWLNIDNNREKSGWQFNNDGTAVQYIRDEKFTGWTWEVRGGMLYIIGGNNKSEDYAYRFEGNDLFMEVTFMGKQVWSAPMTKQ
jgi:hypothetical protein